MMAGAEESFGFGFFSGDARKNSLKMGEERITEYGTAQ